MVRVPVPALMARWRPARWAAGLVLVVSASAWHGWTGALPGPSAGSSRVERSTATGVSDSPLLARASSLRDTPFASPLLPSAAVGRLALGLGGGDRATRLRRAASVLVGVTVMLVWVIGRRLGFPVPVALATAVLLATSGALRQDAAAAVSPALGGLLVALAFASGIRRAEARRLPGSGAVSVVILALVAMDRPALALMLLVPAAAGAALGRRRVIGLGLAGVALAAVAASVATAGLVATARSAALPGSAVGPSLAAAWHAAVSGAAASTPAAGLLGGLAGLVRAGQSTFGLAGVVLAGIGLWRLRDASATDRWWIGGSLAAALPGLLLGAGGDPIRVAQPLAIVLALAAGAGGTWLLAARPTRLARSGALAVVWAAALAPAVSAIGSAPSRRAAEEAEDILALGAALPPEAVALSATPELDRMFLAALPADAPPGSAAGRLEAREEAAVRRALAAGRPLVSLGDSRLRLEGAGFEWEAVRVTYRSLAAAVARLAEGSVVAVAGRTPLPGGAVSRQGRVLAAIGLAEIPTAGSLSSVCVVGVKGGAKGAAVATGSSSAELVIGAGEPIGQTGVMALARLRLVSDPDAVAVEVNGARLAEAADGAAVVVIGPSGTIDRAFTIDQLNGLAVDYPGDRLALVRFRSARPCVALEPGRPVDVTALVADGALSLSGAWGPTARVRIDYEGDEGLMLSAASPDGKTWPVNARGEGDARRRVVEVPVPGPGGPPAVRVGFAGVPERTHAVLQGADAARPAGFARVCGASLQPDRWFADPRTRRGRLVLSEPGGLSLGAGWHGPEFDGAFAFRWTGATSAAVAFVLARRGDIRVSVDLAPAGGLVPGEVGLLVNGTPMEMQALRAERSVYSWQVEAGHWQVGLNRVVLRLPRVIRPSGAPGADPRPLGAAVRRFELDLLNER